MSKTPLLIAAAFALCATTLIADPAQARERSRAVQRTAQGGSVAVERSNARFDSQRQRGWQADGQGNASAARSGSLSSANGGNAGYDRSAYRNADGSAGRQGSAQAQGANGGSATTSGSLARDAEGNVNGSRSTSATAANGNNYEGSTTVTDGQVSRTATCTDAAGASIPCRQP